MDALFLQTAKGLVVPAGQTALYRDAGGELRTRKGGIAGADAPLGGNGTAALLNTGTTSGTIPVFDSNGEIVGVNNTLLAAVILKKDGTQTRYIATADTDAARGVALTNALISIALLPGATFAASPGDYLMPTSNLLIASNTTYFWNGARLYINGGLTGRSGGPGYGVDTLFCPDNATSNWRFVGPAIFDGNGIASKQGIWCLGSSGGLIENINFTGWNGLAVKTGSGTGRGNRLTNCYFTGNTGTGALFEGEYWTVMGCHFESNGTGINVSAGNIHFANCSVTGNTSYGIKIMNASNGAHGTFTGGNINHHQGSAIGVYVDPALTSHSFTFTGTHVLVSSFDLNGSGVEWVGGEIWQTTFICSGGTPVSTSQFWNVKTESSSTTESTSLAALATAKRAKIKINNWKDELDGSPSYCDKADRAVTATLDFPSTAAQTSSELTVTIVGASVNDAVLIGLTAAPPANASFVGYVSADDTVKVRFNNFSAAAIDPASASYRVQATKF